MQVKVRPRDRVRVLSMPSEKTGSAMTNEARRRTRARVHSAAMNRQLSGRYAGRCLTAPTLSHYLVLGAILFAISMAGIFLNRKNVIILLMAIELMLLAVNLNFIAFSSFLGDMAGQVFVFFILTVAAAESAIGLAILVLLFRNVGSIDVEDLGKLKG